MINFQEINNKLNTIQGFIGGEFYVKFKQNPDINVFNEYDRTASIQNVTKKLLLYSTDTPFDENKKFLLKYYNKIYSVNNKVLNDDRVVSLPLGIVDTAETISFTTCYKKRDFSLFEVIKNVRNSYKSYPSKLLYMNYRIPKNLKVRTDSLMVKEGIEDKVTNETFLTENWLLFNTKEIYEQYFKKCLDHIFIACPEGFGIDSYRFYETLYLGRIPVVLHNPVTDMFKELPILFLNEWSEFKDKYQDFIDNFDINNYNFEKLGESYWKKILVNS